MPSEDLAAEFLGELAPAERPRWERVDDLRARLTHIVEDAQRAWPQLEISTAQLVRYMASRMPRDREPAQALEEVRAADLYLACACAAGDAHALAAFELNYLRRVTLWTRGMPAGLGVDDILQSVRERLFVGDGERPPKIATYAGRGDLRMFLRAVVSRIALDATRAADHHTAPASTERLLAVPTVSDPEIEYLKKHYQTEFKEAFEAAARSLSHRQRNLLRHQVVFGLGIDQMAAIYHVHRSTAARWLEDARAMLVARTREALLARLRVSQPQLDSILELVKSQLDVSIRRVLTPETR